MDHDRLQIERAIGAMMEPPYLGGPQEDLASVKNEFATTRPQQINEATQVALTGVVNWITLWEYLQNNVLGSSRFRRADVIVLITDSRNPSQLAHWKHTGRLWHSRCSLRKTEAWALLWMPLNDTTGLDQVHWVWGAVFILQALAAYWPRKHLILADHDAAPTSLWEISDLIHLANLGSRGFGTQQCREPPEAVEPPAALVVSDSVRELNAGLVVFIGERDTKG